MDIVDLKETLRRELPALLREDPSLREFLLELTRKEHPSRAETDERFYELLGELRRDREVQSRQWEEHQTEQRAEFRKLPEQLRACIKTNQLIMEDILAGDDPLNRPRTGSYTHKALIF